MDNSQILENARNFVSLEARAVTQVAQQIDESFVQTALAITNCKGKVFVTGAGTSSFIARRMAHLMAVSGTPALFIPAMDALHGTMGAIQPADVLIAISKSGESDEVCKLVKLVNEKGVLTVGLTEGKGSTLHTDARIACLLSTIDDADPGNFIAMGSTLVAAVWGDALARTLMELSHWQLDKSLDLHPAGGVGKRAEELREQLRGE